MNYFVIHYGDFIMCAIASQITGVSLVCSTVCLGIDQRKHQSSASLAFMNPPVTSGFPSKRASNAEKVSRWWRFHDPIIWSNLTFVAYTICVVVPISPNTVRCGYDAVNFLQNHHKRHPIARPLVYLNPDLYSASLTAAMYAVSRYTGPRYNGGGWLL